MKARYSSTLQLSVLVFCACLLQGCFDGGGGSGGSSGGNAPPANAFEVSGLVDINIGMSNQIEEDDSVGTLVGITVFASDEDRSNNRVRYELLDSDGGRFAIDAETGIVTLAVAGGLSISASPRMILAQAASSDQSISTRTFAITVLPPNLHPIGPISDTDLTSNSFLDSAIAGDDVGITLFAEDMDGATVRYMLTENPGNIFAVDAETGVVSLNRSANGLTQNSFMITALARSQDNSTSVATFTVMRVVNLLPMLDIQFPGASSLVTDQSIHIRGTAQSRSGGSITMVRAEQTHDDVSNSTETMANVDSMAGTWTLDITLVAGSNNIEITATDSMNMSEQNTIVVVFHVEEVEPVLMFNSLVGGVYDAQSNRIFVVDNGNDAVVGVHAQTGQREIISGGATSVGANCNLQDLDGGIALDTTTSPMRILVTDNGANALIAIDIDDGDCSVVSGSSRGSGDALDEPLGVSVDVTGGRAFVGDNGEDAVIAIDLASGNRTVFAQGSMSGGVDTRLQRPTDLEWDCSQ